MNTRCLKAAAGAAGLAAALAEEEKLETLRLLNRTATRLEKAAAALVLWLRFEELLGRCETWVTRSGHIPEALLAEVDKVRREALLATQETCTHERARTSGVAGGTAHGGGV